MLNNDVLSRIISEYEALLKEKANQTTCYEPTKELTSIYNMFDSCIQEQSYLIGRIESKIQSINYFGEDEMPSCEPKIEEGGSFAGAMRSLNELNLSNMNRLSKILGRLDSLV